jgi:lipopolysaccharide/colanic/teichoic acid biosynthesis glycosyltransferase
MQRILDIFFATFLLIVFLPFLAFLCLILSRTGEGEIFFIQERIGQFGKPFFLYKFATMLKNSPKMKNGTITLNNDRRILTLGRFLRKSKINELPQLLNIIQGNMSFVGPRPQTSRCFKSYPKKYQTLILNMRPGLTGIGSIIFRNEEKILLENKNPHYFYNNFIMPFKARLEVWYYSNANIQNYFLCIFVTCWVVFFPKSEILWKLLKGLPNPGKKLKNLLIINE